MTIEGQLMKKRLLLIPALLLSTASFASEAKYELSPMIGYNLAEGNVGIKGDDHFLGGLELQYNYKNSKISPEISILVSPDANYKGQGDTSITRGLLNGVYSFDKIGAVSPFAKAGLGYEFVSKEIKNVNEDGLVLDAGAGLKVPFTPSWSFKAEAIYLAKVNNAHNGNADNNLITMIGLTYSFGGDEQKQVIEPAPVAKVAPVDNDNDGVVDSQDSCLDTPANTKVDASGCAIPLDTDGDGVLDASDKCPNTVAGTAVDTNGCKINLDTDNDGVKNAMDKCPNTPAGEAVNVDGCAAVVNLHINFANNSAEIAAVSENELDHYADFLTKYTNYSAKIVGYTDSRGSAKYNQKLSQKRAEAVVAALINRGVKASQLQSSGMGEANPVADNTTANGRAQNRRIEAELTRN